MLLMSSSSSSSSVVAVAIVASDLHATREGSSGSSSMLRFILSDFEATFRESAKIDQDGGRSWRGLGEEKVPLELV